LFPETFSTILARKEISEYIHELPNKKKYRTKPEIKREGKVSIHRSA
jgi:hypothetical protein